MSFVNKFVGSKVKSILRRHFSFEEYDMKIREKRNPYLNKGNSFEFPNSPVVLGIIYNDYQYHRHFIEACEELKISYKIIDIATEDWIEKLVNNPCDAYLVWPAIRNSIVKNMFDDRLKFMVEELGLIITPSLKETWLYENKLRTSYWLKINNIKHPLTQVFYSKKEAINYINNVKLPVVFKSNLGATASGVRILRDKNAALKLLDVVFKKGFLPRGHNLYDRQRGVVIFQEFLGSIREWRMVRIGDSFFGYEKIQVGDFHSGSHKISLELPSLELLDFVKEITDKGKFYNMDVDIFVDESNNFYVNELQTVFGTDGLMKVLNENPDMNYRYIMKDNKWIKEKGDYISNGFARLRILFLLENLKR